MSAAPSLEQHAPTPGEHDAYYRQALAELVGIGMRLARRIEEQAAETPAEDPTPAFERVSRALRRTILLAHKLDEPRKTTPDPSARAAARRRIIRGVEDSIDNNREKVDADALHRELLDRLDAPDLEDDIGTRPIADIIVEIRRDLGLDEMPFTTPWRRRGAHEIAVIAARAAQPTPARPAPPTPPEPIHGSIGPPPPDP